MTPGTILFLACDGIYDRLSNDDVAKFVCQERLDKAVNPHQAAGKMIEDCMKEAMLRDSYDNLSAISIIFWFLSRISLSCSGLQPLGTFFLKISTNIFQWTVAILRERSHDVIWYYIRNEEPPDGNQCSFVENCSFLDIELYIQPEIQHYLQRKTNLLLYQIRIVRGITACSLLQPISCLSWSTAARIGRRLAPGSHFAGKTDWISSLMERVVWGFAGGLALNQ